jgi:two-component system sensor histidine kinase UhpB
MSRLSIGTRLVGGFLVAVGLIGAIGLVALAGLRDVTTHYSRAIRVYSDRAVVALRLKTALLEQVKAQKNYLIRGDAQYLKEVREQGHLVRAARDQLAAGAAAPADRALLAELDAALESLDQGFEAEITMRQTRGIEAADKLTRGRAAAVVAVLDRIVARAQEQAERDAAHARDGARRTRSLIVGLIAAIAVVALASGLVLSLSVTLRMKRLRAQIDAIAREHATTPTSAPGGDELAGIARALDEMVRRLALLRETEARSRRLEAFSSRVAQAQEEERERIAHELHDGLGQALTAIKLDLAAAGRGLDHDATEARERLGEAQRLADETLDELRRLSFDLRPAALDHLGLVAALESYVRAFRERSGVAVEIAADGLEPRPPLAVEIALYRICQEALTNIARHAEATQAEVRLERAGESVRLTITDNGKGFDTAEVTDSEGALRGIGLIGMERRAEELGGDLDIESRPGEGTVVRVTIPWSPQKRT